MSEIEQNPFVYIVILNWNGVDETLECLQSVSRQTYTNHRILLVDNGSIDDSVERIRGAYPEIEIIQNDTNLGFAKGINVGLRHALDQGAEQILVLNNDLVLDEYCVCELVSQAQAEIVMITATIFFMNDPQRIWSIGGKINPLTLEKTADARGSLDKGQLPPVIDREFVPGGATMISRKAFEEIGLYDERFFLYYEDADFSLQAKRAGLRAAVATRARMWHAVSSSSGGSDSARERYWMARSSVIYFRKNARLWQWPIIIFWRTASAVRTSLRLLRYGRQKALFAYWTGLWDGISASRCRH